MSLFTIINPPLVFVEFGQSSLRVVEGARALQLPLERLENGRLTPPCRSRLGAGLRDFLKPRNWQSNQQAICAIGGRGVSLRRLTLPPAARKELPRLLLLQIESEFPLPPDELAWGYRHLNNQPNLNHNGAVVAQELFVAAVRKDIVVEYAQVLSSCGLNPIFTLGALARNSLCPQAPGFYAILDLGRNHSELVSFENGVPAAIRVLPWGGENLTQAIATRLRISPAAAEKLKLQFAQAPGLDGETGKQIQAAIREALEGMAAGLHSNWIGQKLFLTGGTAQLKEAASCLAEIFGGAVACERVESRAGDGGSAAILGLQRECAKDGGGAPLVLQVTRAAGAESVAQPAHWRWAALALLLACAAFGLRYADAFLHTAGLKRSLARYQIHRLKLPKIDRDLGFLQYLKTNQPPYLDAIWAIANAAPPGARLDSLTMNRRGEVSLRGTMQNSQQAVDFRSKLNASGFFATVVMEDETPSPDRQKLTVRIGAQWQPLSTLETLAKTAATTAAGPTNAPGKIGPPGAATNATTSPPASTNAAVAVARASATAKPQASAPSAAKVGQNTNQ